MIIVTGGAGFIGSNLVRRLNQLGHEDILIVDDFKNTAKARNLCDLEFSDCIDRWDFLKRIKEPAGLLYYGDVPAVMHQGACSSMTEPDGTYVLETNYNYSKTLYLLCVRQKIRLIYASSAAIYEFKRDGSKIEKPRNFYGMTKLMMDRFVKKNLHYAQSQVVGLRYFNVYGPGERHKGDMASIVTKGYDNFLQGGTTINLFRGFDGYGNGEHRRDFTYVGDVVDTNLWFFYHQDKSGIFQVGTEQDRSFNEVARLVLDFRARQGYKGLSIGYIEPPKHLLETYQSFSKANTSELRAAGCNVSFRSIEQGIPLTLEQW
jgi:ADP-L-glycero-D-manno-heptose 6-epimerase